MLGTIGNIILAFIIMSAVSILGLILMFVIKSKQASRTLFYMMAVWGMALAGVSAFMLPTRDIGMQLLAWGFGAMSAVAMLVELCGKQANKETISRLLVVFSVMLGILGMFML